LVAVIIQLLLNKGKIDNADKEDDKNQEGAEENVNDRQTKGKRKQMSALDRMKRQAGDDDDEEKVPLTKREAIKEQRKAEREIFREEMEKQKEEKQERDELKSEARRKKEEEKEQKRREKEEEERKIKEEKAKKEQEEYDQWKGMFSVDQGGSVEEDIQQENQNLLQDFIDHIKRKKVVVLEDLASTFGLQTQEVISRIRNLEKMDLISGVMDDTGKFIYISTDEMVQVANFMKKKGRVSVADLAMQSNLLIDLEQKKVVEEVPTINLDDIDAVVAPEPPPEPQGGGEGGGGGVVELSLEDLEKLQAS
jgi:hypothetical protein